MPGKYQWINYFIAFLFSCVEPTKIPSRGSQDWEFLPLEVGTVSIFKIETEYYLGRFIPPEMETYFLNEEIISKQVMKDGSEIYYVLQSQRDSIEEWRPIRYFTLRKDFDKAVSVIDNFETVELKLPLLPGKEWQAQSNKSCLDSEPLCNTFKVVARDSLFVINGESYSNTVIIERQNIEDPLQIAKEHNEFAIYSQHSGLIYFESHYVEFVSCRNGQNPDCCCQDSDLCTLCAGEIEFGKIEKKSLVERFFPN